jgi:N-acetylglucosaminyl-diphospho-decaprenol L-rhamnosyltransferase
MVVVSHDSRADLQRLFDSVSHLPERPEVIVVDSGSSDSGPQLARDRGAVVLELDGNAGYGAACNAGVRAATFPVVALVNPDVELLDPGLASLAEEAFNARAILAPRLLNLDGSVQDSAHPRPGTLGTLLFAPLPRSLLPRSVRERLEPWRSEHATGVGWAIGACLVARTDLLRALGPFDPSAFLFYEDLDLCERALHAGIATRLCPGVRVRHLGGTSVRASLGRTDLDLKAERRQAVLAGLGRRRRALDDFEQALTFGSRAAGKALLRRGGRRELEQLRALWRARRGPA